ncbi:MAG TPA: extensin family protein [Novosphingobium sp.]|nr:extensin family protein [Novosphingobium sp.]HZV11111.1 extensin family protein [Novosphingobium sp.]
MIPLILLPLGLLAGCLPQDQGHQPPRPRQQARAYAPSPAGAQCMADLHQRQAGFAPLPDAYYGGGCATINTVRLLSLHGDTDALAVSNLGPVTCPLADAFAGWARYGVDRAARLALGSPLARIETMGSYNCRNIAGSDHRSAHATADAIDVSGFVLADGRHISVLSQWSAGTAEERYFLRLVHTSACKRFGTVLGPDYNPAHRNHFHLELSAAGFCR